MGLNQRTDHRADGGQGTGERPVPRHGRAALLRLAGWFEEAGTDRADDLARAAYALHPALHVEGRVDESIAATTAWWQAEADRSAVVEHPGTRPPAPVRDHRAQQARLRDAAESSAHWRRAGASQIRALLTEPTGDRAHVDLSGAGMEVLMELLTAALGAGDAARSSTSAGDLEFSLRLHVVSAPGAEVTVQGEGGDLTLEGVRLCVTPYEQHVLDLPESAEPGDGAMFGLGRPRGATAPDSAEVTQPTGAPEATHTTSTTDATEAAQAPGATTATGAAEDTQSARASEAAQTPQDTDASQTTDAARVAEVAQTSGDKQTTGTTGATAAADAAQATRSSEATEATESAQTTGATTATGAAEDTQSTRTPSIAQATRTTDAAPTAEVARTSVVKQYLGTTEANGVTRSSEATDAARAAQSTGGTESTQVTGAPDAALGTHAERSTSATEDAQPTPTTWSTQVPGLTDATQTSDAAQLAEGTRTTEVAHAAEVAQTSGDQQTTGTTTAADAAQATRSSGAPETTPVTQDDRSMRSTEATRAAPATPVTRVAQATETAAPEPELSAPAADASAPSDGSVGTHADVLAGPAGDHLLGPAREDSSEAAGAGGGFAELAGAVAEALALARADEEPTAGLGDVLGDEPADRPATGPGDTSPGGPVEDAATTDSLAEQDRDRRLDPNTETTGPIDLSAIHDGERSAWG